MVAAVAIPIAAAAINAAGSIASAYLGKDKPKAPKIKETKTEMQRRNLVDELLSSLKTGEGQFAHLFDANEDTFQKKFVEPAQARFKNQIAPAIRQQYIHSGQFQGSGLEDQLLRAGVDMDQLLNEQYGNYQQNALNRESNILQSALGANTGNPTQSGGGYTAGQAAKQGFAGYLSSDAFSKNIEDILSTFNKKTNEVPGEPPRKGYTS